MSPSGLELTHCQSIVNTRYNQKNYMTRDVIKLDDLPDRKGGDVIEMLNKPASKFAGAHTHVASTSPIYRP